MSKVDEDDLRVFSFDKFFNVFQSKMFKKYKVVFAVIGFGFFIGGPIQMGVLGGVLAGMGTYAAMDRLKESKPDLYNWILSNPGWVELISMVCTTGIFGLTLGGVFISLVANFTMSATLDWIMEKDGLIPDVEPFSVSKTVRDSFKFAASSGKEMFNDISADFKVLKSEDIAG